MAFDIKAFVIGVLVGIIIMVVRNLFVRTSYFDSMAFQGKNVEEAGKYYHQLIDDSAKNFEERSNKAIQEGRPQDAKKLALEAQKYQQDLSLAYNTYVMELVPANAPVPPPSKEGPPPSVQTTTPVMMPPPAVPEMMMPPQAPAPAPEMPQAPAPAPEMMMMPPQAPAPAPEMMMPQVSMYEPAPYASY